MGYIVPRRRDNLTLVGERNRKPSMTRTKSSATTCNVSSLIAQKFAPEKIGNVALLR
jgi:hypothetical protein